MPVCICKYICMQTHTCPSHMPTHYWRQHESVHIIHKSYGLSLPATELRWQAVFIWDKWAWAWACMHAKKTKKGQLQWTSTWSLKLVSYSGFAFPKSISTGYMSKNKTKQATCTKRNLGTLDCNQINMGYIPFHIFWAFKTAQVVENTWFLGLGRTWKWRRHEHTLHDFLGPRAPFWEKVKSLID